MFRLEPITNNDVWQATLDAWKRDASESSDEGVFLESDVNSRLHWQREQAESAANSHGYFIVENGQQIASSLLEVNHAMPNSNKPWLKLLSISLRPSLVLDVNEGANEEALKKVFVVLVSSIVHATELIFHQHPSRELKIYGRTPEMMSLFKGIVSAGALDAVLESIGLSARVESKWLVLARRH